MMPQATLAERSPDDKEKEAVRVRLAARANSHEILDMLAQDEAITVRAAVALNPLMAHAAHGRLVRDPDERVRVLVAGKIARLLPGLSGAEHAAAQNHVHQLLRTLAEDAAIRVRLALTDALGAMPHAPRDVVLRLANDPEPAVSDPVLRLSPTLTDADLIELLATPPHPGAAKAVAARNGLSAVVAAGIAAHADTAAVVTLLSNPSANIQEATLEALAGRAGNHPEWHEPLLRRPALPAGALGTLARLVTGHLIDALLARPDLPEPLVAELRTRLEDAFATPAAPSDAEALAAAHSLLQAGMLNEGKLLEAAIAGDHRATAAMLAAASNVTPAIVQRAIALRSAKGLVSLARRGGLSMHAGLILQTVLGHLAPHELLHPTPTGDFPLSRTEMDWQIELLHEPGH